MAEARMLTIDEARCAFERWVRLAYQGEGEPGIKAGPRRDHGPSAADISHSALLGRLLAGQEPCAEPPPRIYSYPAYALCGGEEIDVEVLFLRGDSYPERFYALESSEVEAGTIAMVSQDAWKVLADRGDGSFLVEYPDSSWKAVIRRLAHKVEGPDGPIMSWTRWVIRLATSAEVTQCTASAAAPTETLN